MILYIDLRLQCSFLVFLVLVFSEFVDGRRPPVLLSTGVDSPHLFARVPQASLYPFLYIHVTHCRFGGVESFFDQQVCIRRSSQPIGGRSTTDSFSQQTFVCFWPPYAFERPCVPVCVVFCQSDSQMSQVMSKRLVYLAYMPQGAVNCSNACCFALLNACVSVSSRGFEHKWGILGPRCRKLEQMRENMGGRGDKWGYDEDNEEGKWCHCSF